MSGAGITSADKEWEVGAKGGQRFTLQNSE